MIIVFLDFDGVVNSKRFLDVQAKRFRAEGRVRETRHMIDPDAVARLNGLLLETGAKVVISSSWRWLFDLPTLREILVENGFTGEVIDVTPVLPGERGFEIEKWLRDHAPDATFVIFDDNPVFDNPDTGNLHHRFVQTSWGYGLLDEHIDRARKILTPT
jgi:hypothetical protein